MESWPSCSLRIWPNRKVTLPLFRLGLFALGLLTFYFAPLHLFLRFGIGSDRAGLVVCPLAEPWATFSGSQKFFWGKAPDGGQPCRRHPSDAVS
jgi:hypothetical protein